MLLLPLVAGLPRVEGAPGCNFTGTPARVDIHSCRPDAVSAQEKAEVLNSLPLEGEVKALPAGQRRKLATLQRVLKVHSRHHVYDVKVIAVPQAWIGLHGRAVLLISYSALQLLTAQELQALGAHEIGHEYVWNNYADAEARQDARRIRELELFCDAIAVSTLELVGVPVDRLIAAAGKIYRFNVKRLGIATNDKFYPSLKERREFINRLRTVRQSR